MIIDRLANAALYTSVHPGLAAAFEWLRATDLAAVPSGTIPIDGDRVFALVSDYLPRDLDLCQLEAHRRHWDVQYIVRGEERMGWVTLDEASETVPYEAERDVAFLASQGTSFFRVPAGCFVVFSPDDVHMPAVAPGDGTASMVRKIVVKVRAAH